MMATGEPTRERVEAYEKALCETEYQFCRTHRTDTRRGGCPVAVAAARVEAEETDALRAALDRVRAWMAEQPPVFNDLQRAIDGES
jgi:hypothetical protein